MKKGRGEGAGSKNTPKVERKALEGTGAKTQRSSCHSRSCTASPNGISNILAVWRLILKGSPSVQFFVSPASIFSAKERNNRGERNRFQRKLAPFSTQRLDRREGQLRKSICVKIWYVYELSCCPTVHYPREMQYWDRLFCGADTIFWCITCGDVWITYCTVVKSFWIPQKIIYMQEEQKTW